MTLLIEYEFGVIISPSIPLQNFLPLLGDGAGGRPGGAALRLAGARGERLLPRGPRRAPQVPGDDAQPPPGGGRGPAAASRRLLRTGSSSSPPQDSKGSKAPTEINLLSRKHSLKVKREGVCDPDRAFKGINAFSSCRKTSFLNSFNSAEGC